MTDSEDNYEVPEQQHMSVQEERAKYGEEKPRAKDTARLIWASKPKKEPNAKELDFQTAEIVYPNAADAQNKKLSSFTSNTKDISQQPNRLIWGDNLLVMQALLAQGYEGQIDLIYIDPPFNTGENFNFSVDVRIGKNMYERELPINERLAYSDTWERGKDSFLDMIYPRLTIMQRLLSSKGLIFVHCDWHISHYLKVILDEIFDDANYRNEILVEKTGKNYSEGDSLRQLPSRHDVILVYAKSEAARLSAVKIDLTDIDYTNSSTSHKVKVSKLAEQKEKLEEDEGGKFYWHSLVAQEVRPTMDYEIFGKRSPAGNHWYWRKERTQKAIENYSKVEELRRKLTDKAQLSEALRKLAQEGIVRKNSNGIPEYKVYKDDAVLLGDSWIDVPIYAGGAYPTAKTLKLLQRIIDIAKCNNVNLVADFFVGSGTTALAAEENGLRWICADVSKTAVQFSRSRLVSSEAEPFIIENLGNYQRQLVYAKEINLKQMYDIVLKLYGAAPLEEWKGFGISKDEGRVLVFVCEPDRPMTARKAVELARTTRTMDGKGYRHLVILAWDYELDFDDTFNRISKTSRIDMAEVEFKVIPSDVYRYLRSTKVGDTELANKIEFYQKPYLKLSEPQIVTRIGDDVRVKIKIDQYVVKDIPLKDESKRPGIEKLMSKNFAYLIDYWTIDWEYDGETFRSRWQAIRDRKSGEPVPVSADATLRKGQKYTIAIRAVDVFGNDASMTKEIDLR